MVEFIARLLFAGSLVGLGWFNVAGVEFDLAWKTGAMLAALAVLVGLVERRDLRNPGVAGLIAVLDAISLALIVGKLDALDTFGFVVLLPVAYAAARFGSLPSAMAPLAAAAILIANFVFRSADPAPTLLGQTALVLAVGLLTNQRRTVMTVTRDLATTPAPLEEDEGVEPPVPEAYLQLRENYRTLRDEFRDLQRRGRRDRLTVRLIETRRHRGLAFYRHLAATLAQLTEADQVVLHTTAQFTDSFVARATAGDVPEAFVRETIPFDLSRGLDSLAGQAADRLRALQSESDRATGANIVLFDDHRPTGMLTVRSLDESKLAEARATAEEAASLVAWLIREEAASRRTHRRLHEAELLYEIATTGTGATSPAALAARVVAELADATELDHLGAYFLDGDQLVPAALHGRSVRFLESMSFAYGPGIAGWLKIGAPELAIFDVFEDQRCDKAEALKQRVGSYCVVPIQFDEAPYGFLSAASGTAGAIDVAEWHTLRLVAAEIGQAFSRRLEESASQSGLMTAREFQSHLQAMPSGWLVYLEPLRRQELLEVFGRAALQRALRDYAHKLRARLPRGGAICRRPEGDYVAFLPEVSESFARSWTNEAAAMASMVAVEGAGNRRPLAMRARTAPMGAVVLEGAPVRAAA
ncbi:MAG: GAF domain-containing protein [Fimbriimonadaceae bacterium]|nr:GAF domain-containing protein [Fimbriimonadaceae bacterium]